jgi:hypothetical protein
LRLAANARRSTGEIDLFGGRTRKHRQPPILSRPANTLGKNPIRLMSSKIDRKGKCVTVNVTWSLTMRGPAADPQRGVPRSDEGARPRTAYLRRRGRAVGRRSHSLSGSPQHPQSGRAVNGRYIPGLSRLLKKSLVSWR